MALYQEKKLEVSYKILVEVMGPSLYEQVRASMGNSPSPLCKLSFVVFSL